MEKRHVLTFGTLLVGISLIAMLISPYLVTQKPGQKKIGVVVTLLPLADFAGHIGKDNVDVTVMVPPGASPHTYDPTPSQMVEVSEAEMYVMVGSGVEFELVWMDEIREANSDMLICDTSQGIEFIEMAEHEHGDEHEHHGGLDPHIWLSPQNAKIMVENIKDGFTQIDPKNADYYAQNAADYVQSLDELDREIREALAPIKKRKFIVFHPAWGYYARDYNLTQIPIEVEGKEPSAQDLAHLIDVAREQNTTAVFVSPQFSSESAEVIADEIGAEVIVVDPLAENYTVNLRQVTENIVQVMD